VLKALLQLPRPRSSWLANAQQLLHAHTRVNHTHTHTHAHAHATHTTAPACSAPGVPFIHARGEPAIAPRSADMGADPFGLLLSQRTIVLGGEVNDFSADAVISQLLMLDSQNPKEDIKLFINSPGGSVTAGMGVYDAIQLCRANVQTYCFGLAASMGAFLLGAGTKGMRYAMPNARIMIHQPLGGASGQAIDVEIQVWRFFRYIINVFVSVFWCVMLSTC
jgi:ATP-dependent Clp endopeptidase proteolytic subunit ClpP